MPAEQTYRYTWQDIERYLNGSMNAQEMHDLERAALNDPLLADAIDGYQKADAAVSSKHLNEIAALLHKTESPVLHMPAKKNNWWRWAAAAGVMGILGMSAWLMMRDSQNGPINGIAKNETSIVTDSVAKNAAPVDNLTPVLTDTTGKIAVKNFKAPDTITAMQQVPHVASPIVRKAGGNNASTEKIASEPKNEILVAAEAAPIAIARQKTEDFSANRPELFKKSPLNEQSHTAPIARSQGFKVPSFSGRVTDEKGKPLPGAYVFSGNVSTTTNLNGDFNFSIPGVKDSMTININAIGYEKGIAMLTAGKDVGIALQPAQAKMDEIVVVGYGSQKKKATVGSIKNLKADTLSTTVYPYPDGGWENFYDDLIAELGVNKSKADKLLHLKFMIENGIPSNFTIIKTPDLVIADRAIAAIKKGPRWKNFKNRAYAEVKIKVE